MPKLSLAAPRSKRFTLRPLALALPLLAATAAAQAAPAWVTKAGRLPLLDGLQARELLASGESLHVVLSLKLRNEAALDAFNAEATRVGSPAYGQWLSDAQFLSRHAPTEAQVAAVVDHLRKAGFVNITVAPNRLLVEADGTAGVARSAFRTELARFEVEGRRLFANIREASVPKALDGIVQSVLGLQNVDQLHTLARVVEPSAARGVQPQAAVAAHGFNPLAYQQAYGVGSTPTAANTTVGIISAGDLSATLSDFAQFKAQNNLSTPTPTVVTVGTPGTDTSGTIEWDLDSQSIAGITGGGIQGIVFYAANSLANANITAAYNRAVTDGVVKLVNVSLGECESSANSDGSLAADDQIFKAGIAKGIIFSVSSGDSGSHECSVLFKTKNNVSVSSPASSPYVVAVGGTTLLTDAAGNYASESAWSGSGGGYSAYEARPSWQANVVTGTKRGVPDVALAADPNTGAIIIVNGKSTQVGGTSLASPLFVGLYARIESATGNSHGFPNPSFYSTFPTTPGLVHDVTTGSNGTSSTTAYYAAKAGWDPVTGFGSPIIGSLYSYVAAHPAF